MAAKRINRTKAREKFRARHGYSPSSDSVLDTFINGLTSYEVSSISDTSSSYGDSSGSCYSDSGSSYSSDSSSSCSFD